MEKETPYFGGGISEVEHVKLDLINAIKSHTRVLLTHSESA